MTLIEEVGKLPLLFSQKAQAVLRNHAKKYDSAISNTLYVNSRVARIYGPCEARFAEWYRTGELFKIRNRGLYAEMVDGSVLLPDQHVSNSDALLMVCMAGEVYAEIQGEWTGTGPEEWQRVLREIDVFRDRHATLLESCLPQEHKRHL